jgi:hypothetical protein
MEIKKLLAESREIWGKEKSTLSQIIVRTGKIFGDICRWERDELKNKDTHTDEEIKKELGNMIFCNIKWCDDLGYDPEECIEIAKEAQKKFVEENKYE